MIIIIFCLFLGSTQQQSDDYRSARHSNEYDIDNNNNNNNLNMMSSNFRGPYFDTSVSKNVTALVGKTAYLNCRVRNLGNKTVSFVFSYLNE